jgi:hypothetical protein
MQIAQTETARDSYRALQRDRKLQPMQERILACFASEDDARKAYAVAAERLHGEFKNLGGEA